MGYVHAVAAVRVFVLAAEGWPLCLEGDVMKPLNLQFVDLTPAIVFTLALQIQEIRKTRPRRNRQASWWSSQGIRWFYSPPNISASNPAVRSETQSAISLLYFFRQGVPFYTHAAQKTIILGVQTGGHRPKRVPTLCVGSDQPVRTLTTFPTFGFVNKVLRILGIKDHITTNAKKTIRNFWKLAFCHVS